MSLEEPINGLPAQMDPRAKPEDRKMRDMLRADILAWHTLGLFEDLQRAHRTRHCWWATKNSEGTKEQSLTGKKVFPWPGAPDSESRLCDQMVNEHVDIHMMAWFMGDRIVRPRDVMDDGGTRKAQAWRHVLDYELDQSDTDRVNALELLWNSVEETGYAVWREGWENRWRKGRKTIAFEQFTQFLAEQAWNEAAQMQTNLSPLEATQGAMVHAEGLLLNAAQEKDAVMALLGMDPLMPEKEAKQVLKQWRKNRAEPAEYFAPVPQNGKPKPRALVPGIDCLFPGVSQNPGDTRFWEFEWITRDEVLTRAKQDDWTEEWTQQLLNNPGLVVDWTQIGISFSGWELNGMDVGVQLQVQALRDAGMYQIAHLWQWGVDEDGLVSPFHTIVSGHIEGHALHECDPLGHGRMPLLFVRRENKRNVAVSSKGIGHETLSPQLAEKQTFDGLLGQAQLRAFPPLLESMDGGGDGLMPGARMPMQARHLANGGGPRFLDVPEVSAGVISTLDLNRRRMDDFYMRGPEVDPDAKRARKMRILQRSCVFYREMLELLCLNVQQDIDTLHLGSVNGMAVNQIITRDDLEGDLDVTFRCDVGSIDLELAQAKIELALKALSFDRSGQANTSQWFREVVSWIDNRLLTAGIQPLDAATKQATDETNALIAQMVAGIVVIPQAIEKPVGNPDLRAQIIDQWAQLPANQQRMQNDPMLMEQMQKYHQFLTFQVQQFQQNADIGRQFGVDPELKNLNEPMQGASPMPPQAQTFSPPQQPQLAA